jgi:hypothetical protein
MNRERIEETVRLWQAQPDKAKGKPMVIARAEGSMAVMEHGSFSWRTDMPVSLGGTNEAPSPTALLLSALAGCAVAPLRLMSGMSSAVSAASICWRQVNLGDRLECYDLFRAICARLRFGDLSVWPICSSWHQA